MNDFLKFASREEFFDGWRLRDCWTDYANNCQRWLFERKGEVIKVEGREFTEALANFGAEYQKRQPIAMATPADDPMCLEDA